MDLMEILFVVWWLATTFQGASWGTRVRSFPQSSVHSLPCATYVSHTGGDRHRSVSLPWHGSAQHRSERRPERERGESSPSIGVVALAWQRAAQEREEAREREERAAATHIVPTGNPFRLRLRKKLGAHHSPGAHPLVSYRDSLAHRARTAPSARPRTARYSLWPNQLTLLSVSLPLSAAINFLSSLEKKSLQHLAQQMRVHVHQCS
jgi:hypothetical protein